MGQLHSLGDALFDLKTMVREQRDRIVKTRRELHQIPEPAYTEKKKESTSFADLKFHFPDLDISTVRVNEDSYMVDKSIAEIA